MWLFPHQQAEKSLQNQHVLSILQVGSHQLQYRFFRTNKPKSHHKTNTFCPITRNSNDVDAWRNTASGGIACDILKIARPAGVIRRRRWRSRWPSRSPGAVDTVDAGDLPASYRDGSWGSHTQARDAVFTGTRQTQPTKIVTFPRNKAKKSPQNQHVLSILTVGPNQRKNRLSRTSKPKSHNTTNTFLACNPSVLSPGDASSRQRGSEARFRAF